MLLLFKFQAFHASAEAQIKNLPDYFNNIY